jgi:Asp-tRNA(Asn)/Glu-tRNA(Gln) amidotransferase A subunit family amidase
MLKELGAIVFGKTVTTEFAYFAPGPTRNPYHLSHTPGGSSSGSAAAVSAGLVPFAFGTQTIGSIIRPASYCGIVGFKPTYGRISSTGVIPLAPSVDTVGFFASDMQSTSFMAKILVNEWNSNNKSSKKPVLGIPDGPFLENTYREMKVHFKKVWNFLNYKGYTILNIPVMHNFEAIYEHHNVIVAYEAAKTHEKWFAEYGNLYHPKSEELVVRGQRISKHAFERSLASRLKLRNKLLAKQKTEGVDLWISPSAQGAAPKGIDSTGDPVMNLPWTHCGFPTINIPAGLNSDGLPMGLQVTASWYRDENLLSWGSALESNFKDFNEKL